MKKIITVWLFSCLLISTVTEAQERIIVEGGLSIGAINSLTDIGGTRGIGRRFIKDLNIGYTSVAGGVFASILYNHQFGLRLEATYGKISAHDSILKGINDIAKARFNRNLGFRTDIKEISLIAEIHPLYIFSELMRYDREPPRYSPYLLAGIGYFAFNPQGKLGDEWIDLQPLSTEGQGFVEYPNRPTYKLQQINVPLGGGIRHQVSPRFNIRGEFVLRKLFTDYLDDLSTTYINPAVYPKYFSGTKLAHALALNDRQIVPVTDPNGGGKRGTLSEGDSYFTFNFKIGYNIIGKGEESARQRQMKQLKCPAFF